jgi:two-component system alkaline phosphatase synthesis response regulator PhoP
MPSETKTILIVDDEQSLLFVLIEKFTREGFVVFAEKNGQAGLERALAEHPDLILLDIIMPVMDGMTMLVELRKDPWGKNAKVIMLTNLSEVEREKSQLQDISGYLVKSDWKLQDVIDRVKDVIE